MHDSKDEQPYLFPDRITPHKLMLDAAFVLFGDKILWDV